MLSCKNLTVKVPDGSAILKDASLSFKPNAMNAVIGPSGCGKTTLVKAMLKIISAEGDSFYAGDKITKSEDLVGKVGFAPQFTCVHNMLTVCEAIQSALDISVADSQIKVERLNSILKLIGLEDRADTLVGALSGGQLRRIGLGVELACNPQMLVCDEVTSGLDPLSENAILDLMTSLCKNEGKTFVCIIHNLAKLNYFDNITVVFKSEIVFQGTLPELLEHFEISNALFLYDRLNEKSLEYWREKFNTSKKISTQESENLSEPLKLHDRPSMLFQLCALLKRRYKLFFRDSSYLLLTMAISFGFPIIVVIFALGGLPQIESLSLDRNLGILDELQANLKFQISAVNTATIVTGLILFQAVLLALMGSNNSAREISAERALYEKERLLGLRPNAYAISKIIFTFSLALFQGVWMCGFVKFICKFPGDFFVQGSELVLICVAMTAICLAFSSIFSSPEKSNLLSIYLVGFQLPLSGVVLALPEALKWVCRPFISTYWGWAGYMTSMRDTPVYDAYIQTRSDWEDIMPSPEIAAVVLILQTILALAIVFWGCSQKKWNNI